MYVGLIYGYPRLGSPGLYDYVGRIEDLDLAERHGEHLEGNLRFDEYLRSLPVPTYPVELIRVQHEDKSTWLFMMAWMEMEMMFQHRTYRRQYPEHGGWNFALPHPLCYSDMGHIGGRNQPREVKIRNGRVQGLKNAENKTGVCGRSPEKMSADGRKGNREGKADGGRNCPRDAKIRGGLKGGHKAIESGQLASLRTPEHQRDAGRKRFELHGSPATPEGCRKGGLKGGLKGSHATNHLNRGIVNLDCDLCFALAKAAFRNEPDAVAFVAEFFDPAVVSTDYSCQEVAA
jgi:hypothetical protein